MNRKAILALAAACSLAVAFPLTGTAKDKDKDNDHANAVQDAVVEFGQPQPQGPIAAGTHFLAPDDVTINKGGTVTFVVNGGGHGVAIYPVAKKTTRDDIWPDLCNGPNDMTEADRVARSLVDCNGTAVRNGVVGTQNLAYTLTDGKNDIVVLVPANVNNAEPRVDDQARTLLGTSGRIPGNASANPAGAFLTGTNAANAPGNRIQYRFLKTGRYLIICMNRAHAMNDHMFGFVNVADDDDDDHEGHGGGDN
jgi:plastocyanin